MEESPVDLEGLEQILFHGFRLVFKIAFDDVVELFQQLHFHIVGGFVGKSDGQDVVVMRGGGGIFETQRQVFLDDGIGFP